MASNAQKFVSAMSVCSHWRNFVMPSCGALHACPANGLMPALNIGNTGDIADMKLFPFLLDGEVCRCGIKLFPSWKPDLWGSLGCALFVRQAMTLKDIISRGARPVVGSCSILEGLCGNALMQTIALKGKKTHLTVWVIKRIAVIFTKKSRTRGFIV